MNTEAVAFGMFLGVVLASVLIGIGWIVSDITKPKRHFRVHVEYPKTKRPITVLLGDSFASDSPRLREELAKRAVEDALKPKDPDDK